MLIKSKTFTPKSDPRLQAGDEAEKQMAFLLNRRFEDRDDVFLLHDLRIQKGKHAFQIDHLVVTRFGLSLVESKSIHGKISITRHDERREHWNRNYRGREEGMPSPIRQVQEQGRLLHEYLRENREEMLGKLLFMQKGFGYCPVDTFVGVSTSATFELRDGTRLPAEVFKADEIAPEIERRLKERERYHALFLLKPLDPPWSMSLEEALTTARFLLAHHTPLHAEAPKPKTSPVAPPAPILKTAPPPSPATSTAPATPGGLCPACGKHPLAIAAGPLKPDGSRDRFLACLGNKDGSCTWRQPFAASPETAPAPIDTPSPTPAPEPRPSEAGGDSTTPPPRKRGTYYCYACHVPISRAVASFCWDRKKRFGGKAYCVDCQSRFAETEAADANTQKAAS